MVAAMAGATAAGARAVLVLYGSQTGNAEDIAKGIAAEATARGITKIELATMNDYEKVGFPGTCASTVVMVCSTTGDGDPPDNATKFARFLKKQPDGSLAHLQYTMLALGDTNYENFANGGKRISVRVKELGAREFYPRGVADDAVGLHLVVDPWLEGLWPALAAALGVAATDAPPAPTTAVVVETAVAAAVAEPARPSYGSPPALPEPAFPDGKVVGVIRLPSPYLSVTLTDPTDRPVSDPVAAYFVWPTTVAWAASTPATPVPITVRAARCLTAPDAEKRTLAVQLELPSPGLYKPGDAIGLVCPNDDVTVDALLARLCLDGTKWMSLALRPGPEAVAGLPLNVRQPCTVRDVFRYSFDLRAFPKKALLRTLAEHTSVAREKMVLYYLCSRVGAEAYNTLRLVRPTLLDLFAALPGVQPPLEALCEHMVALQPRPYTVVSAPEAEPTAPWIAFNVVHYTTGTGAVVPGLCTTWLDGLVTAAHGRAITRADGVVRLPAIVVPAFPKAATDFTLPADLEVPVVMIGPGTGGGAFVAFLQRRRALLATASAAAAAPCWMVYGCRRREHDYLFRTELEELARDGAATRLVLAFSRETGVLEPPQYAGYVQAALVAEGPLLDAQVLQHPRAHVFVCGDATSMATGVHTALLRVLEPRLGATGAAEQLQRMSDERRYVRDVWS